ncbi:phage tail tape measure protein [Kushneria sp. TE3]|uniref:phage tail tape measure protein n=1 Tax=Kushneria sp. TE3 TaxID=3449832 RepID=UPI003F683841
MARDLKLQVLLNAVDKATRPLKKITRGSGKTAEALKASRDQLRSLERQQKDLSSFRKLKSATRDNSEALNRAQERMRNLRMELKNTSAPTKQFQQRFLKAQHEVERLNTTLGDQRRRLGQLRTSLKQGGVSTDDLSGSEKRLAGQIRQANTALDAQKRKMGEITQAQKKAAAAADRYQRGLGRANTMRSAGFTGLATGGSALYAGSRLLSPGVAWGEQMSAVQAVGRFSADDERFQALRQQSRDLGSTTAFSANEVGAGQEFLLRAGMSAKAIGSSMEDVLNLAIANNTELGRTADIASNIAGTFKIDLEKDGAMGRVADVLSATASRANVDLEKLGDTVKYLGGAEDLDLSLEQASAMAGLLGNIGIQGSQAGTTMRGMMNRLVDPSKKAAGMIENLGVQISNADGEMRDMPDILRDINEATADLGNADRKQALQQIFGAEAGSGMAELVDQMSTGALDDLIEKLTESYGENAEMASVRADNLAGDAKSLRSAWEEVGISITDTNDGALRDLVQWLTEITRGVGNWIKENPKLAGTIAKLAAGTAALVAAGGALTIMMASLLGPIVTVRYGLNMLGVKTEGLGGKIYQLTSRIIPGLGSALTWLGRTFTTVGRAFALNPIGLAVTGIALAALLIYKYWQPIAAFFAGFWQGLKTGLAPVADALIGTFSALGGVLMPLKPIWDGIASVLGTVWGWVSKLIQPMQATTEQLGAATSAGERFGQILGGLVGFFPTLVAQFATFGANLIEGLIGGITSKVGALKDSIVGIGSSIGRWFADVLGINSPSRVFMEFGGWTIEGLIQGLTAKLTALKDSVVGIAGSVTGWFKDKLDIHSPSRVFASLGGHTVDGLTLGLDRQRDEPAKRITDIASRVRQAGAGLALGAMTLPAMAALHIEMPQMPDLPAYAAPRVERPQMPSIDQSEPIRFDTRPPLASQTAAPSYQDNSTSQYTITINAPPGSDEDAIAKAVSRELDRRERERSARQRSSLWDRE